jgi:hypothetical protein
MSTITLVLITWLYGNNFDKDGEERMLELNCKVLYLMRSGALKLSRSILHY